MATGSIDERSGEIQGHERCAYFAGVRRLQDLHTRLAAATDLHAALEETLATALDLTGTDRGCLALVSGDGQRLEMVAHSGYCPDSGFLRHFLNDGSEPASDAARWRERVVIDDVETRPSLLGTKGREVMFAEDIRSMQSTPIITRTGEMVGVLSTQFRQPHRPADDELRLADILARTAAELVERHRTDTALRAHEARQADDSAALRKLNDLSSRLWQMRGLQEGLEEVLAATVQMLEADFGNIQLLDPKRGVLTIEAQRGFERSFLECFREVSATDNSACGRRLRPGERIFIEDIETDALYAPMRDIARAAGYRAVQSTPLISRDGASLGMISTHWRAPHKSRAHELNWLDLYARQASDFIERLRTDVRLRESEERYRTLFASIDQGFCVSLR